MTNQSNALATRQPNALDAFKQFIRRDDIIQRFEEVLDSRTARPFVNSVILAVQSNDKLLECTKTSVVMAAIRAASLRLSVDPSTGQAWIVPYGGIAQFQVGYKGLRDMAIRTNKYRTIHAGPLYAGQQMVEDQLTGSLHIEGRKTSDEIIGWQATYVMLNGFTKTLYMSVQEIHEHAKKYSKGYNHPKGVWKLSPADMEKVTVLRLLLRRWAVLDPYDVMVMDQIDDEQYVEMDTIEATFTPEPVVMESESDLLVGLGYDPEPAQNVSRETSPAPVVTETYPMSPDMAFGEKDSNGKLYAEYTTEQLAKHSEGIAIAIGKEKDPEKITALQFKQAAIGTILQYRANHPEA